MKRAFLFSSGVTAIIVGVFALAYLTSAGAAQVAFTGQGTVQAHDLSRKTMNVYFTKISEAAQAAGLGTLVEVSANNATFYKGKVKIKQGNIAVGDRVTIRGTLKNNERFIASRVESVDTGFVMKGKLRTFSRATNRMTVDVSSSTYKSSRYKDKTVEFAFHGATKFYTQGVSKSVEDVTASDQEVQLRGKEVETLGTSLEVASMHELP